MSGQKTTKPSPSLQIEDFIQHTREAVFMWDRNDTITGWNGASERLTGYSRGEILGQSILAILPQGDQGLGFDILRQVQRGETIENVDAQWTRKDGKTVDISLTLAPIRDERFAVVGGFGLGFDLSTRRRLQAAERDQALLASVFSSSDDAIISTDLDGKVTTWNRSAENMFGYNAAEMIGSPISILVAEDCSDEEGTIQEQIRLGQKIDHLETQRVHKSGTVVPVSLTLSPIKDKLGRIIGASRIARDIGNRRQIEKAERDQLFLASIVSGAEDAIVTKDLNGIVTTWNSGAEKLFGYEAAEMIGQPITKLILPDYRDEEFQILARIRRGERIEHYDTERLRKDGRTIQVSLTISPIKNKTGQIIGASKIARDITERKQWQRAEAAQSFLGALVESAEDAIISKNLDGIVTSWNPAAEKMFGYTAQEMIGKPVAILIPPDQTDEEPRILEQIRLGHWIAQYETKRVRKDGSLIDVSLTVSPIKNHFGHVVGASKIARDITETRRSQEREHALLRDAQEARHQADIARNEAEKANTAKDDFLAIVSHELRTPITAILGWTRMLADNIVTAEHHQKAFQVIDRNARIQAKLIEDLLDISRIISGKLRIEFKAFNLIETIQAAIDVLHPASEGKGVKIESELAKDASSIVGDPERIQQAVWNLLSNAIKFTPSGGLVRIDLRRSDSQVEIRVADNGIGISPEFVPHIFKRFSQANPSSSRTGNGLGVGLAIVKSLVELHGGVISVSSPGKGKGTVFTIKLPIFALHQNEEINERHVQNSRLDTLVRNEDLFDLKILIVDNEPDTCSVLRIVFEKCGALVQTAQNANLALEMFDSWNPDLLISDIRLPNMDGYELIRIIRQERKGRIPAIALTAMTRTEDRMRVLASGFQLHVSKPVLPLELVAIVKSLLSLVDRTE